MPTKIGFTHKEFRMRLFAYRSRYLRALCICMPMLALIGCSTAAQRAALHMAEGNKAASIQFRSCIQTVNDKPEYKPLVRHTLGVKPGQYSMAQLTDETLPTSEEGRLLVLRHDEYLPCRQQLLENLSASEPAVVPVFTWELATADDTAGLLVERKITWGEAARRQQRLLAEARAKLQSVDREVVAELNAAHRAELGQRQAAADAFGNAGLVWSAQQQLIAAASRPVFTTCNQVGAFTNCTSR